MASNAVVPASQPGRQPSARHGADSRSVPLVRPPCFGDQSPALVRLAESIRWGAASLERRTAPNGTLRTLVAWLILFSCLGPLLLVQVAVVVWLLVPIAEGLAEMTGHLASAALSGLLSVLIATFIWMLVRSWWRRGDDPHVGRPMPRSDRPSFPERHSQHHHR